MIFTTNAGLYILDIVDHFINNYALVFGGLLECLVVGYILKAYVARKHVNSLGERKLSKIWDISIKYVTPVILVIILIQALKADISTPYEGYPVAAILFYGVGMLLLTLLIALYLSFKLWKKPRPHHDSNDEHLWT